MEKAELIIKIISGIAALISAVGGIGKFRKQKEHEQAENKFRNFYIPAMKLLEKHLYISKQEDLNKQSFLSSKTAFHKLIDEQYMYVPFKLQDAFNDFEKSNGDNKLKLYRKFCDYFINFYRENAKACGMKHLTVWRRNKLKWYSSTWKMILTNANVFLNLIYSSFIAFTIWLVIMAILLNVLKWLGLIL
ncbi:MAG: hypothetical protein IJZ72_06125 [Oscillospiraceae bacterium]|nr:hypothetical protein [Oscillospiraceae bacterium]